MIRKTKGLINLKIAQTKGPTISTKEMVAVIKELITLEMDLVGAEMIIEIIIIESNEVIINLNIAADVTMKAIIGLNATQGGIEMAMSCSH